MSRTTRTPLLWRHIPPTYPNPSPYYDVTHHLYYDVTTPFTMTSLTPLLWRHVPPYYDVTYHPTMTSHTPNYDVIYPLLWRHAPQLWRHIPPTMTSYILYYDVTYPQLWRHIPPTMTSLTLLLWRHIPTTMTPHTLLLWRHLTSYYDVTNPVFASFRASEKSSITSMTYEGSSISTNLALYSRRRQANTCKQKTTTFPKSFRNCCSIDKTSRFHCLISYAN